ncbi:hypothetical protein [Parasitella parasitica]|uniref:Zn(2)-C6 fungal-type domain-containing protein n=1 Tax=Parasitella parasitica TaxID=35722 RepID=A0A0B7NMR1_9FUNG|nr:hypothetical protein [Parasitella parasitica]
MNSNAKNMVDGDKTRRKRLKVVSACGECRRKKTKCNGEKPCAGCMKARVECKYVNSQKSASVTSNTTVMAAAAAAGTTGSAPAGKTASAPKATHKMAHPPSLETKKNAIMKNASPISSATSSTSTSSSTSMSASTPLFPSTNHTASSIESIEERLGTIENILRALLCSGKNKHLLQGFQPPAQEHRSESHYYNHHQHHQHHPEMPSNTSTPSSSCGDMYSSPHLVHAPHIHNRSIPREKRQRHEDDDEAMAESKRSNVRDDFGHGYHHHHPYPKLQLAPIKIINHTPGMPTSIRNLLNDQTEEEQQHQQQKKPRWYPTSSSSSSFSSSTATTASAFYRMSSPRNEIINSNSATTAAGTLS